jgi:hypothetical protein
MLACLMYPIVSSDLTNRLSKKAVFCGCPISLWKFSRQMMIWTTFARSCAIIWTIERSLGCSSFLTSGSHMPDGSVKTLGENDTIDGSSVLPGSTMSVKDIFYDPSEEDEA